MEERKKNPKLFIEKRMRACFTGSVAPSGWHAFANYHVFVKVAKLVLLQWQKEEKEVEESCSDAESENHYPKY